MQPCLVFMDDGLFSINATLGASLSPEAVAALLGLGFFVCFCLPPILKTFSVAITCCCCLLKRLNLRCVVYYAQFSRFL